MKQSNLKTAHIVKKIMAKGMSLFLFKILQRIYMDAFKCFSNLKHLPSPTLKTVRRRLK